MDRTSCTESAKLEASLHHFSPLKMKRISKIRSVLATERGLDHELAILVGDVNYQVVDLHWHLCGRRRWREGEAMTMLVKTKPRHSKEDEWELNTRKRRAIDLVRSEDRRRENLTIFNV
ncbi:uncharacterized protein LOC129322490 [Prosopis cineraria]|uniref:uncharacterized protein LOC129322490 n=1 Tax=Prosopis cineraria TaxID=364024 RepID=UPI00240F0959|nr:uncharacterized protein LOC129322490 [Prosopis cineraria]